MELFIQVGLYVLRLLGASADTQNTFVNMCRGLQGDRAGATRPAEEEAANLEKLKARLAAERAALKK